MRLSAILAFVLLSLPASAADTIADQAQAAFGIFAGGKSQLDFNMGGYGGTALANIAGKWVSLGGPAAGTGIETYGSDTEKACKSAAVLSLLLSPRGLALLGRRLVSAQVAIHGFFSRSRRTVDGRRRGGGSSMRVRW